MYKTLLLESCFISWSSWRGNAAPSVTTFQEEAWNAPLHAVKSVGEFGTVMRPMCHQ